MSSKRILIAGGAGFIGSHLCDRFLADGYDVVALDNFVSGSESNVAHLAGNPHFQLVKHDLIQPLPELGQFDVILHFASPASPNPKSPVSYMAHPLETLLVNSVGSQNLLELAKRQNSQIVFASTSEVYGNPEVSPQPEEYLGNVSCNGPRSCYDEAKRFMEALAFTYYREFGTKIKVIRIFNTYGSRMRLDDGRFVPNLINSFVKHQPFAMFGNGETTRSFGYVDDLVEGIVRVVGEDKMIGNVVNLGNPQELTLNQAVSIFESVAGTVLTKTNLPTPPDDPQRRNPDIKKAKELLGWQPKVSFEEGIRLTLPFYKSA